MSNFKTKIDQDFLDMLIELDNPRTINKITKEVGDEMKRDFDRVHRKTGAFANEAQIKRENTGNGYRNFVIYSNQKWWKGMFVMMESGTAARQRNYMSKKKNIKFKEPKSTGYVKGDKSWTKLMNKYHKIYMNRVNDFLKSGGKK